MELNEELEKDDNTSLLQTIKISRNLFSLTERLPKSKYRGRSNDLPRNNSVDSHMGRGMQHAATLNGSAGNINNKLKQMGVNSQMEDSLDGGSPGKSASLPSALLLLFLCSRIQTLLPLLALILF